MKPTRGLSYELASGPRGAPPWRLLERAGQGATSTVWKAQHERTGQLVAFKVAREEVVAAEAVVREAVLLARTQRRWGPMIVDAGPGFVATEWVVGEPLDPKALEGNRERVAAVVAHAVARSLEELHEAGVRHGDVKPANVLVSPRMPASDVAAERGATLVDFGLATPIGVTALGGTARYAAPEVRQEGSAGPAADLWALGVMLAEICDEGVAVAQDPSNAVARWDRSHDSEPARWAEIGRAHV